MGVGAGVYMYDVVVKKFTFAISSPDEFLLLLGSMLGLPSDPSAGCLFLFLLLESIQSHSPGLYTPCKNLPKFSATWVDSTADNADNRQPQTTSDDRLLSEVTIGLSNAGSKQLAQRYRAL